LRLRLTLALLFGLVLAGCSSKPPSPESVVRAWSQELNQGDNQAAAKLFAPGAEVIQAGMTFRLNTRAQAVAWNQALPCSGEIISIKTKGDLTTATFVLGDRPKSKCDGPGQRATAIFRVRKGKIVLWHQTSAAPAPVGPAV
jgi:limonene-1,2-epoxide hydrolase